MSAERRPAFAAWVCAPRRPPVKTFTEPLTPTWYWLAAPKPALEKSTALPDELAHRVACSSESTRSASHCDSASLSASTSESAIGRVEGALLPVVPFCATSDALEATDAAWMAASVRTRDGRTTEMIMSRYEADDEEMVRARRRCCR